MDDVNATNKLTCFVYLHIYEACLNVAYKIGHDSVHRIQGKDFKISQGLH
jgi:hypothetical protein